jgi:hypothetical protein
MAKEKETLGKAIDEVIGALEPLDAGARATANERRVKNLLFVLALAFVLVICCTSHTKTKASAPANPVSIGLDLMTVSQEEKTVEQVRKNIQVLRGLPDWQLFPVMNFIGDSLGVHCDYCHVTTGTDPGTGREIWLYERDDKTEKIRGREMIKMVLEINKTRFGGNQVVTCYSCHRGTTRVERVVPLPPVDFTMPRTERMGPAPLSAEQILSNYLKAVGGRDAGAKFKTIVYTGIVERSQGRTNAAWQQILPTAREITVKGPDKYLGKITTPQGVILQGIDGAVGWVRDNNGSRQLTAAQVEQAKQSAALFHAIKVAEQPAQMRVLGLEKLGDRDAYLVAVTTGPQTTRKYFFDAQTGLLLRRITTMDTMFVPLPEQVDFEDYRDVGGVKLPFTIRTSGLAAFTTATYRFADVRLNVVVDDAVFKMPARQKE